MPKCVENPKALQQLNTFLLDLGELSPKFWNEPFMDRMQTLNLTKGEFSGAIKRLQNLNRISVIDGIPTVLNSKEVSIDEYRQLSSHWPFYPKVKRRQRSSQNKSSVAKHRNRSAKTKDPYFGKPLLSGPIEIPINNSHEEGRKTSKPFSITITGSPQQVAELLTKLGR